MSDAVKNETNEQPNERGARLIVETDPLESAGPQERGPVNQEDEKNAKLACLLDRIQEITESGGAYDRQSKVESDYLADSPSQSSLARLSPAERFAKEIQNSESGAGASCSDEPFLPIEPETFLDAGLTDSEIEGLILKYLNARAEATGRDISDQVKLPFRLIDPLLLSMKTDRLIAHRGASMMNDFVYELTDLGRERARKLAQLCTYFGSAPVALSDYIESIKAQSIMLQQPTEADLRDAFEDLLINQRMFNRLGPAINSGRGLFLFGPPGNGKTSIAERVTKAFGETTWIPRSIGVDGEMIRLYDPSMHDLMPLEEGYGLIDNQKIDKRWVRIRRPTIVVGGELTMDALEVTMNTSTNVSEAPIQMKSNCGTLVIDDFGRQRMTTDELLNRWIVPLEKRFDYLNLSSGKKIQVPFDQLIIFSTNLEPRDLVDDAFLRRIPYKIEVSDPSEDEFRDLFKMMAPIIGVEYEPSALEYLIKTHYKTLDRPYRCCQPRDLLSQIRNYCLYIGEEPRMTNEYFDYAVENYFAVM